MRESTGLYPRVRTDGAGSGVVSQAGAVLLIDTARAAGLDRALSVALEQWRRPTAVHDPAKILLDLAVSVALGGDCLADVAVLRAAPEVFGRVASDPTISRLISSLAGDADRCCAAIDAARAVARKEVWSQAGAAAPDHAADHRRPVVVDIDATLVTAHSEKEAAAPTFKRGFGHHPLTAFVDHGSEGTGEPVGMLLRAGNAGSNTAAGAPRGASSYPQRSWEELGRRFLGLVAYLEPKGEGDNSMPVKQRSCSGIRNGALRDPRDMAKAALPES